MSEADDRIKAAREAWRYDPSGACEYGTVEAALDDLFAAVDERDSARATAEYWKAEHLAGNQRIAELEAERDEFELKYLAENGENAALLAILRRVEKGEIKPTIGDLGMEVHIARGGTTD